MRVRLCGYCRRTRCCCSSGAHGTVCALEEQFVCHVDIYCYYYYYSFRRLPSPPHVLEMTVCRLGNDGARAGNGQAWDPAEQLWGRCRISRPGVSLSTYRHREKIGPPLAERRVFNGTVPATHPISDVAVLDCGSQCAHTEGVTPP